MKTFKQLINEEKSVNLQTLLDTLFSAYVTIQHHHWNVVGENFGEYHEFFGDLYGFAYDNVDKTAEQIRALGLPAKLSKINTNISTNMPSKSMMQDCLDKLNSIRTEAVKANEMATGGLSNYLEGLIDEISKKIWMAESYLK